MFLFLQADSAGQGLSQRQYANQASQRLKSGKTHVLLIAHRTEQAQTCVQHLLSRGHLLQLTSGRVVDLGFRFGKVT